MKGGALCLARAYDLDEVGVQLIHMREGACPREARSRDVHRGRPRDRGRAGARALG
jgi:hypothetical protein